MAHKGHWGEYTGNAKWSRDHAHTKVTSKNYDDSVKDDAAHIDYLKRDINYDAKHSHNDENMTADEKHISKLAGDMKYDKEHHGSPAKNIVGMAGKAAGMASEAFKGIVRKQAAEHLKNAAKKVHSNMKNLNKKSVDDVENSAIDSGVGNYGAKKPSSNNQLDPRLDPNSYEYDRDYAADVEANKKAKKDKK